MQNAYRQETAQELLFRMFKHKPEYPSQSKEHPLALVHTSSAVLARWSRKEVERFAASVAYLKILGYHVVLQCVDPEIPHPQAAQSKDTLCSTLRQYVLPFSLESRVIYPEKQAGSADPEIDPHHIYDAFASNALPVIFCPDDLEPDGNMYAVKLAGTIHPSVVYFAADASVKREGVVIEQITDCNRVIRGVEKSERRENTLLAYMLRAALQIADSSNHMTVLLGSMEGIVQFAQNKRKGDYSHIIF